jgi:hypothetical protein
MQPTAIDIDGTVDEGGGVRDRAFGTRIHRPFGRLRVPVTVNPTGRKLP